MALSTSYNYVTTRDDIIKRALRIIGALGQGETPVAAAVTEAAQALNDIFKEWQADGLQLWKYIEQSITLVAGTNAYNIGTGATINTGAPLKIVTAYRRTTYTNGDTADVPMTIVPQFDYRMLPNKQSDGPPTHLWYKHAPATAGEIVGVITLWPTPDASFVSPTGATGSVLINYMAPLMDFDAASDNPDIPNYLINALVWSLADQLSYEYGVPVTDRAQISKKAQLHKAVALSFDQEEGSLFFHPMVDWSS
jgi:hypothetical protein